MIPPCSGGCTDLYLQPDSGSQIVYLTGSYLSGGYVGMHVQIIGIHIICNGCLSFLIKQPIVILSPTYVDNIVKEQPSKFFLRQNYPNPFNPSTNIEYSLPSEGMTNVGIYTELGERIETLVSRLQSAGTYTVVWHAAQYPTGVYFAVVSWDRKDGVVLRQTTPMLLIK